LSHSTSPFCVGYFQIGSHKLFAQTGFEPQSSWSLPPRDYMRVSLAPGNACPLRQMNAEKTGSGNWPTL
jgi:hypothetical protein